MLDNLPVIRCLPCSEIAKINKVLFVYSAVNDIYPIYCTTMHAAMLLASHVKYVAMHANCNLIGAVTIVTQVLYRKQTSNRPRASCQGVGYTPDYIHTVHACGIKIIACMIGFSYS